MCSYLEVKCLSFFPNPFISLRGQPTVPMKGQMVTNFGFPPTLFLWQVLNSALHRKQSQPVKHYIGQNCVPINLYLQKQAAGHIYQCLSRLWFSDIKDPSFDNSKKDIYQELCMCVLILICRNKCIHLKTTHQGKNKSKCTGHS